MADNDLLAGISIAIEERDPDYVLVEVRVSSYRFAGTTRAYLPPDRLAKLAMQLSGFPVSTRDDRTFEFGSVDPKVAGGYLAVRFTVGSTGVGTVTIDVADDPQHSAPAKAAFSFQVMPASMDEFVRQLHSLGRTLEGSAELEGCERFSSPR